MSKQSLTIPQQIVLGIVIALVAFMIGTLRGSNLSGRVPAALDDAIEMEARRVRSQTIIDLRDINAVASLNRLQALAQIRATLAGGRR